MSRKRDELRAQERQARRTRITGVLTSAFPAFPEGEVAAMLASLRADRGIPLRDLDEHLAAHPDALTSGDPGCPAVIVRLIQALRDAGHGGAGLPGCSECGRSDVPLARFGPGGRVCQACGAKNSKRRCGRCGRTARIFARRDEGGICYSCYRVDPQIVQECAGWAGSGCLSPAATTAVRSAWTAGRRPPAPASPAAPSARPRPEARTVRFAGRVTGGFGNPGGPAESAGGSG